MILVPGGHHQQTLSTVQSCRASASRTLRWQGLEPIEGRYLDTCFLDHGNSWKWVVSFTFRPFYPQGNSPIDRMLGGSQSRYEWYGKIKILDLTGNLTLTALTRLMGFGNWSIDATNLFWWCSSHCQFSVVYGNKFSNILFALSIDGSHAFGSAFDGFSLVLQENVEMIHSCFSFKLPDIYFFKLSVHALQANKWCLQIINHLKLCSYFITEIFLTILMSPRPYCHHAN